MTDRFRPHLRLISLISRIVPRRFRADWKQEWEAELAHRESLVEQWRGSSWKAGWQIFRPSLASFWDALAMQPRRLEEEVMQDLRFGFRMLLKNKGITVAAVLSLALGIGANTALFSVFDAMMLRELPVKDPDQLVLFNWVYPDRAGFRGGITFDGNRKDPDTGLVTWDSFSFPTFERFKAENQTLTDVVAYARIYRINVVANGTAEIGDGEYVSGDYFSTLGVNPVAGRPIVREDDNASAAPVAVLGHRYWQQRFGLDPSIVGKSITINNVPVTVVGIAPPAFAGTLQVNDSPDIYIPMALEPAIAIRDSAVKNPEQWWLQLMGRLRPGVGMEQVKANFETAFTQIAGKFGSEHKGQFEAPRLHVVSGSQGLHSTRESYTAPLRILTIIIALILLIACANVANLLLSRVSARQREIATRMSLGATRLRLLRQLLTESVLLASLGGIAGIAFAFWGKELLLRWGPWNAPTQEITASVDLRVLVFALAVSVLTGLLFGIAPAIQASRKDLKTAMAERTTTKRSRVSKALVTVQVAMSIVLVVAAGLFLRTLQNLQSVNLGFNSESLLLFRVEPQLNGYDTPRAISTVERITERVQQIPGVVAVTASHHSLAEGRGNFRLTNVPEGGRRMGGAFVGVRSNFFETMEMPMVLGRSFSPLDDGGAPKVAVVNEAFARQYFPNGDVLGQKIWDGREIVGVVRDATYRSLRAEVSGVVYWPYVQDHARNITFEVRTAGDPTSLIPSIREAVREIDLNLPVYDLRTQDEATLQTIRRERMFANLSMAFGGLALFLVCVGLYGVMSYSVVKRTNEIGIRLALGAGRLRVMRLIMRESLIPIVVGVLLGLGSAAALKQTISSVLFGIRPEDPATVALSVAVMVVVAVLAGYLPARRASRVDPMTALRYE